MKVMKKQNSQKLSLIQAEVEVQLEDEWGTSDDMYFFFCTFYDKVWNIWEFSLFLEMQHKVKF